MAAEEGEKELRRSAPAAASKLRVPTQQKGGEALQKPATTEEDASTHNGQREKRREERRERRAGEGEERDEARERSGIEGFGLPFSSGLPEPARSAWFSRGRVQSTLDKCYTYKC